MRPKMEKTLIRAFLTGICALIILSPAALFGEDPAKLRPAGYVNDYAGVLTGTQRTEIDNIIANIERASGAEITVVTVKTTSPLDINSFAVELFQKWGVGKRGKDNGILIVAAINDRNVRIEVGYGLEGAVTDLQSKMIIQDIIVPYFKKGDYYSGMLGSVAVLAKLIEKEYNVKIDLGSAKGVQIGQRRRTSPFGSLLTLLLFILIFGFRFGTFFFLMGSGGGYWSGGGRGGYGGGFGGFGGGFSGGGGASGSW